MLDLIHEANFYKLFLRNFECLVGISLGVEDHELVRQLQKVPTSPVSTCNSSQQGNMVRHVLEEALVTSKSLSISSDTHIVQIHVKRLVLQMAQMH